MPDDQNPPEHQPFPGQPNRNNRKWIPAEWAETGEWTGSPKLSGGVQVSLDNSEAAPRSLNRPDQRYALSPAEMQSRREARGAAEYPDMFFLITELDRFEVQTKSGKTVDAVPFAEDAFIGDDGLLHLCQCEDDWRLRQSGYDLTVVCKHVVALRHWLDVTDPEDRMYGLEYVAEVTPYDLRTLERLCKEERIVAEKVGRQWGIPQGLLPANVSFLLARIVDMPPFDPASIGIDVS